MFRKTNSALGRLTDTLASFALVAMALTLAGATALVGA